MEQVKNPVEISRYIEEKLGIKPRNYLDFQNSEAALYVCLNSQKYEYLEYFRNPAWSERNIALYMEFLKTNPNEPILYFEKTNGNIVRALIENDFINRAVSITFPNIWSVELINLLSQRIQNQPIDINTVKNNFQLRYNPTFLGSLIAHERFDLIDAFDYKAWIEENVTALSSKLGSFLAKGFKLSSLLVSFPQIFLASLEFEDYAIPNHPLNDLSIYWPLRKILEDKKWTEKLFSFFARIVTYKPKFFTTMEFSPKTYPYILKSALENHNYDYIRLFTYNHDEGFTEENMPLFISNLEDILRHGIELSCGVKTNPELLKAFLALKYYPAYKRELVGFRETAWNTETSELLADDIENVIAYCGGLPSRLLDNPVFLNFLIRRKTYHELYQFKREAWTEENVDLLCDYPEYAAKCSLNYELGLNKSPKILRIYLREHIDTNLNRFAPEAWTRENLDLFFEGYLRGYYHPTSYPKIPYLLNKIRNLKIVNFSDHRFKEIEISPEMLDNLDNSIWENYDLLYSIGKYLVTNEVNINSNLRELFKFIYATKSDSIIILIRSLIGDDLNNASRLFDENGITQLFKNRLFFNPQYREYAQNNGINISSDIRTPEYLQYLKLATLFPKLDQNIFIDPDNISEYFDTKGIKKELLDDLFLPRTWEFLADLTAEIKEPVLEEKKQFILDLMKSIDNQKISVVFFDYVYKHYDELSLDKIKAVYNIVRRVEYSNSSEMRAFGDILIKEILDCEMPEARLNEIEMIFLQDTLPVVGKLFAVFKKLHPDYKSFSINQFSTISPTLKGYATDTERDRLIFYDLIKIALGSNNRSLIEYLQSLMEAERLFKRVKAVPESQLTEKESNILKTYEQRIRFLSNGVLNLNIPEISGNTVQKVAHIEEFYHQRFGNFNNIPDFIVNALFKEIGFTSISSMLGYATSKIRQKDIEHRNALKKPFKLEKGDFIKGSGDTRFLEAILHNGSLCKEFLGDSAGSDATPLDTDLSLIEEDEDNITAAINKTEAKSYGPVYLVLKGSNPHRFDITRKTKEEEHEQTNKSSIEAFYTGAIGKTHYGIRTGFASSEIDYIITNGPIDRIGLEIAINGVYIPIVNTSGEVTFTPDDYDKLRSKMNGLSYYGINSYKLDTSIRRPSTEINEILASMDKNKTKTKEKADLIRARLAEGLANFGITLKDTIDLSINSAVLFNTGSTGRYTNLPGDGDFDYTMQVDREIYLNEKKMEAVRQELVKVLGNGANVPYSIVQGDIRELKTTMVDMDGAEQPIEIDITFTSKTDKTRYASDVCVSDRLNSINTEQERNLVKANIILAKKFLKGIKAYKPARKFSDQGGMGGIGVENWILQHGGTLYSAAKSFMEVANRCVSFEEFANAYSLPNFGYNHMAFKKGFYPHDDYIRNMNNNGYQKMKTALAIYIRKYEEENADSPVEETIAELNISPVDLKDGPSM